MPHRILRANIRFASLGLATLALACPATAYGQVFTGSTAPKTIAPGSDRSNKNVVYSADTVIKDDVNNTVALKGHVELVQGGEMLLAENVIWNQTTDIVIATGNVKLVNDTGDIYFGDYLELTDDMRQAFMKNVSGLLSDNSRVVGQQAIKDGNLVTITRGVYSPCELCVQDPTQPPTWTLDAVKIIHDSDEKRLYYHDAWFDIDGVPVAWTPYFSTYDPSVKRADGFLETLPGYRSQLGMFLKTTYYFDIAPDIDAVLDGGYYGEQGPLIGGQYRERFDSGFIQLSGSLTESDIRQYPTPLNQDDKTIRGHLFGVGEFDLDDNWRAGFELARTEDDLYVLKYSYSSLQILPTHGYVEGFFDRDYINVSLYSFQDLRPDINTIQPHALPYATYSFFGDPGETLGGRWSDTGSLLALQRYPGDSGLINQGEGIERLANNLGWSRKIISDTGLVTTLNASLETDYYWAQDIAPDPTTNLLTAKSTAYRVFPQAYAVVSYPLERPIGYANLIVEPIVSAVVAPARASNGIIPNEDSQDVELDISNLFSGNRFPGVDRLDDGSRITYGIRTGLYNLGTGYTTLFFGQSYRISGDTAYFTPGSGLQTRLSDYVGELDIYPGRLFDIDYRFEWSNDLQTDRTQEVNFRIGPEKFGVVGTYLFAGSVVQPSVVAPNSPPDLVAAERNEMNLGAYYRFNDHWSMSSSSTTELSQPRAVLRYGLSGGYNDDCSTFTINITHDQTLPVGGTSGTAVFIQFSLKNLGIFKTPSVH